MVEPYNYQYPLTSKGDQSSQEFFQWLTQLVNSIGSGLTLLETKDMTGLASYTVSNIPSTASQITLVIDVTGAGGAGNPLFRFGLGTTPATTGYTSRYGNSSGTAGTLTNGIYFKVNTLSTTSAFLKMDFYKVQDAWVSSGGWSNGTAGETVSFSQKFATGGATVDRVQFLVDSATIASGYFAVYYV